LSPQLKNTVLLSFPHYGHAGIVESARELYTVLEGQPIPQDKSDTVTAGFLSSLLGDGCECNGYNIEIVGHSLGGSVAALLGIKVSLFTLNYKEFYFKSLHDVDLLYLAINLSPFLDVSLKYEYLHMLN